MTRAANLLGQQSDARCWTATCAAGEDTNADGKLTLEMLNVDGTPSRLNTKMTRAFHGLEQRRVAELLAAANAAEFFIRPEPEIGADSDTCLWRVHIINHGRSRELVIADRDATPELERLAKAARACLRDRQVLTQKMMTDAARQALVAALRNQDL